MEAVPLAMPPLETAYSYVVAKLGPIMAREWVSSAAATPARRPGRRAFQPAALFLIAPATRKQVTRRGLALAGSAALLTYSILLSAFLCLTTTPPEATVAALRWILAPLRVLRVDVDEVALMVLLSLRFLSLVRRPALTEKRTPPRPPPGRGGPEPDTPLLHCALGQPTVTDGNRRAQVFEEIRNLALGVAVRGVDWQALGGLGQVAAAAGLASQLFKNFFVNAAQIAGAMEARPRGPLRPPDYRNAVSVSACAPALCAEC